MTWIFMISLFLTSLTTVSAAVTCQSNDAGQLVAQNGIGLGSDSTGGYSGNGSWPSQMGTGAMSPGMMNPGGMNSGMRIPGGMNPSMMNPGAMSPGMMNPGGMNSGMMIPGFGGGNQWLPSQTNQNLINSDGVQENSGATPEIKCFKVMPNGELVPIPPSSAADQLALLASQNENKQEQLRRRRAAAYKKCMANQTTAAIMEEAERRSKAILDEAKQKSDAQVLAAHQEAEDVIADGTEDSAAATAALPKPSQPPLQLQAKRAQQQRPRTAVVQPKRKVVPATTRAAENIKPNGVREIIVA